MDALIVNLNLAIDKTTKIPALKPNRIYRFASAHTQPGGKGVNVARVLKELGCKPVIAGFVSGHSGRWIEETLARERFDRILVRHSSGESRTCYSIVDAAGVSTDFSEEGPAVPAPAQKLLLKKLSAHARNFRMAAVCGRMSMGLGKDFYGRMTRLLKKAGCFTAYDTSGEPLMEGLLAGADMVKINGAEFAEIAGEGASRGAVKRFFRKYSPRGLKALIVTEGPRPTLAISQFGFWEILPVPLGRIASPVGAGDSFMGGFICGFMKGLGFEENLRLASGCSASDCLTLGAGRISGREAEAFARKIRVRKI